MRADVRSVVLTLSIPLLGMGIALAGVVETKLLPSDGDPTAKFGSAVSMDGTTAAIGAAGDLNANGTAGAVYIFELTGGSWSEEDKLIAGDGSSLDLFGQAVALDGDTLIVGAPDDDDNGLNSGSAYVFSRSGGVWTQEMKLLPSDGAAGERFGRSVAVDEDDQTAVIGSVSDAGGDIGRAYIFERQGGTWIQLAKLFPPDGTGGDVFGNSVAIKDEMVAIGAWGDDDNGLQSGSVYIYKGGTNWNFHTKVLPADGGPSKSFGSAVSMTDELLVVGSDKDSQNGTWAGSAYVFRRSGLAWNEEAKLTPSDPDTFALFGESVAVHGDSIVVGAERGTTNGVDHGTAYVFGPIRGEWTERFRLAPPDLEADARFGRAVTLWGESAIVGAPDDDDNGFGSGSAYAYDIPPLPPDDVPAGDAVGAAVLLLLMLGSGAWFIQQR